MSFSRPTHGCHYHADPIGPDFIFKGCKKKIHIFFLDLPAGTLSSVLEIRIFAKIMC